MLTKFNKEDYYKISKMNRKSGNKTTIKTKIKKKVDAWKEMDILAKKLKVELSKEGYIVTKEFTYGVEISNKELDAVDK